MSARAKTIASRVLAIAAGLLALAMVVHLIVAWRGYQQMGDANSAPFAVTVLMDLAVFMGPALVLLAIATVLSLRPKIKPEYAGSPWE